MVDAVRVSNESSSIERAAIQRFLVFDSEHAVERKRESSLAILQDLFSV